MLRILLRLLAAGPCLAFALSAQHVHDVQVVGDTFVPHDVIVCAGDTVRWTWSQGFHSVESGLAGVYDFHFTSGSPVFGPATFEVRFDAAFLQAHPEVDGIYDYYCLVHFGIGMQGRVIVAAGAGRRTRNGSGVNPLTLTSANRPVLGTTWLVSLDCSAHAPGTAVWFASGAALEPPLALSMGELLVDTAVAPFLLRSLPHGGGSATFPLNVPADPALCGRVLFSQGLCLGSPGPRLSNALDGLAGPP